MKKSQTFQSKISDSGLNQNDKLESILRSVKINITIKLIKKEFLIYQNNKLISRFRDELKVNKENFFAYKLLPSLNTLNTSHFEPPIFGITTLGNSHGFDTHGSTSGFIIWVNKRGIMIDPPPYSSQTLRLQGISPMLIEKVIITHCHADHDSCLLYTSPSPRDLSTSRMPSSA